VGAGAKVAVVVVLLAIIFLFVPVVSMSSSNNYIVASSSGTIYESLSLNILHCGGYYLVTSSSVFGQSQSSTGYGFYCNAQTSSS
jgi:hypothetical protein